MEKLVRDRIPETIKAAGGAPEVRIAPDSERLSLLTAKLREECAEFEETPCLEELADIAEVLRALATAIGEGPEALERARREKAAARGAFEAGYVLKMDGG